MFLETLGEACAKTAWQVRAYCLMPDHIHLVLSTTDPNLVVGMKWLLGTYAGRCNRRYQLTGHLFANRYRSLIIDPQNHYLQSVTDYVHLNPARAGLLSSDQALSDYSWTSLREFLSSARARAKWLNVGALLGVHGLFADTAGGWERLKSRMEKLRVAPEPAEFAQIRRGWYLGTDRFKRKLFALVQSQAGLNHYGAEIQESAEARAEAIVREAMKELYWKETELGARPKGDPQKLLIARRLRKESSVTLDWIAKRLRMGAPTYLAHLLYWHGRKPNSQRKSPKATQVTAVQRQRRNPPGKLRKILLTDPDNSSKTLPGHADFLFDPSFD